ncbi:hypothetical protein L596_024608 [Steinernema carpocapsae]|uniref:Uncharacterized protein n=1 Tax=Steinernema carpocapsae TaxID=34508 RepID=A0A4U5M577_STECR|nr:hypothetical protein L596_024608 [Steinernema carpocapsae]
MRASFVILLLVSFVLSRAKNLENEGIPHELSINDNLSSTASIQATTDFQKPAFWPWASGTREPRSWTYKQLKEFDISEQKVIDKNPERPEIAKNRAKNEIPTITGAKYVLVAVELSIVGIAACCYCAAKNANIPQNSAQGHDMRGRASEGSYRPHQPDNSSQRFYEAFDV